LSQRTFIAFLDSQHSLNEGTKKGYLLSVRRFQEIALKSFEECYLTHDVVHKVLAVLDEQLEDSTWNLWLQRYQRLAKWLSDVDDEETPKLWRKIEPKKIDWNKKLKDKHFSEDEVLRLLDVTDNPRDKAFFAVGADGGLRPGELLGMNVGDCKPQSYGFDITVSGKTGTRVVQIVWSASVLRYWLNHHPLKHDRDAPLWIQRSSYGFERISYSAMNKYHLKRYCKRAGIYRWKTVRDKKTGLPKQINAVSLHYLRHTSATWTAKSKKVHVSVATANEIYGWTAKSPMFLRYMHMSGKDSKSARLALAGIKEETEEGPSVLAQTKCLNCGELNGAGSMFCAGCGYPLSKDAALELLERKRMDDDFRKMQPELTKLMQEYLAKKAAEKGKK
jgi:integrase